MLLYDQSITGLENSAGFRLLKYDILFWFVFLKSIFLKKVLQPVYFPEIKEDEVNVKAFSILKFSTFGNK